MTQHTRAFPPTLPASDTKIDDIQSQFVKLNQKCWCSSICGHFYFLGPPNYKVRLQLRQSLVSQLEKQTILGVYRQPLLTPGGPPKGPGMAISISHCRILAGFIFEYSPNIFLGLDIEQKSRITKRVVNRVSNKEEIISAPSLALLWGAKEAAFKTIDEKNSKITLSNVRMTNWKVLDQRSHGFVFCCKAFQGEGYIFESGDLIFAISRRKRLGT